METQQIPRTAWPQFLVDFSQRHENRPVTIRFLSERLGAQVEVRDLPLIGLVSGPRGTGAISILIGKGVKANVDHTILDPFAMWVETEGGRDLALAIDSTSGGKTVLELSPERPRREEA